MASAASFLHSSGNDRFNAEAAAWDQNPFVHQASQEAQQALLARFPLLKLHQSSRADERGLDVLEIGCGTGLLSFRLAPYAEQIVAVDAAQGMIDVLKTKIQQKEAPRNIDPICVLLEDPEDGKLPPEHGSKATEGKRLKFDLIISHLVLHHIPDLKTVLQTMLGCLKKGGKVALTDFENFGPQAKRFHPLGRMAGVERHGIHPEDTVRLMIDVGFSDVHVDRAWTMRKLVEKYEGEFGDQGRPSSGQGEMMDFPFVMCTGERS